MRKWSTAAVQDAIDLEWTEFSAKHPGFVSFDGWRRKRYNALKERLPLTQSSVHVPSARPPKMEPVLTIEDPNILYVSDMHAPFHSEIFIDRSIQIAKQLGIRRVVIGGDTYNFAKLSRHGHMGPETDLEDDADIGGQIIELYLRHFDYVDLFRGNHDWWFGRKLDANWSMERLVKGTLQDGIPRDAKGNPRLRISSREWMLVGDNWMLGHPRNYSGRGGQIPADRAQRVQKNVIGSHVHVFGIQQTVDGRFVGVDPGCMTDQKHHWYIQEAMPGQFSEWTTGFVVLRNGKPLCFNDLITDWAFWGC